MRHVIEDCGLDGQSETTVQCEARPANDIIAQRCVQRASGCYSDQGPRIRRAPAADTAVDDVDAEADEVFNEAHMHAIVADVMPPKATSRFNDTRNDDRV